MMTPSANKAWLDQVIEETLEPDLPICDPHHHLWEFRHDRAAHRYLFFCARADLSGFSDFAETYADHRRNARRYQHALDSLGVKR